MPEYTAIIADDEEHLRKYLKTKLKESWPELTICGEAENGNQAIDLIHQYKPEIAFLDIRMPGFSGMDVAKKVSDITRVVFITAYDKYAIDAFENGAIDYLLKPVSSERLLNTIKRLKAALETEASGSPTVNMNEIIDKILNRLKNSRSRKTLQWIKAQHRDVIRLIPVTDIYYFQSSSKYTSVVTKGTESLIKKTIKDLEKELDPDIFWRIHRGTIINVNYIEKISHSLTGRYMVKLKDITDILSVSRSYTYHFKQM